MIEEGTILSSEIFPLYAIYVTNGTEKAFCGMMVDKKEAELFAKNPQKLLEKEGKTLSGNLSVVIDERVP